MSRKLSALVAALVAISSVADAQTTVPISQLPSAATPLGGTEMIPCVQGGVTKNCLEKSLGQNLDSLSVTGAASLNGAMNVGGLITPTSTIGLKGTTAGDNVQAGSVGEYLSNSAANVTVSGITPLNVLSLTLTPGDWNVSGAVTTQPAGSTTTSALLAGVSTTTGALANYATGVGAYGELVGISTSGGQLATVQAPIVRINVSTTTTVFLVAQTIFTGGTMQINGFIQARRIR